MGSLRGGEQRATRLPQQGSSYLAGKRVRQIAAGKSAGVPSRTSGLGLSLNLGGEDPVPATLRGIEVVDRAEDQDRSLPPGGEPIPFPGGVSDEAALRQLSEVERDLRGVVEVGRLHCLREAARPLREPTEDEPADRGRRAPRGRG